MILGLFLTTVVVFSGVGTDPVNAPKLLILGGFAGGSFALIAAAGVRQIWESHRATLFACIAFLLAGLNALFQSESPVSQNWYGVYGRQTGLLTYALLIGILLLGLMFETRDQFKVVIQAIFLAGIANVVYCSWVLIFGDFIGWNNTYNNLLGLFGNPNYISAFLGIFIGTVIAFSINNGLRKMHVAGMLLLTLASLISLYKTNSLQGALVLAAEITLIGYFYFSAKYKSKLINLIYGFFAFALFMLVVFGILQKGPFDFLYKKSVSLRGTYWKTGWSMGVENPIHGVGFDAYGDWYRTLRPPIALVDTPGVQTQSNASHNVVIDFFAAGGVPLLVSYLALLILGLLSIIRIARRAVLYDPIFVALTVVWVGYQLQSLVSINQIGLAVWGWALTGILIAYESSTRVAHNLPLSQPIKKSVKKMNPVLTPNLISGVGILVGSLIALPPLNADAKWFSALKSRSANQVEASLNSSAFNPSESMRYAEAINIFQSSGLPLLARKYVLISIKYNPRSFYAWKQLYLLSDSSKDEKLLALQKMTELDPLNPDVLAN